MITNLKNIYKIFSSIQQTKNIFFISLVISVLGLLEIASLYSLYLIFSYLLDAKTYFATNSFYKFVESFNFIEINQNNYLQYVIILVFIIYFIKLFFSVLTYYLQFSFSEKIRIKLTEILLNSYIGKSFLFHVNTNISKLIRNINIEIGNFCTGVVQQLISVMTELVLLTFIIIFLFFFNTKIVVFSFLYIFPFFILYSYLSKKYFFKFGQVRHELSSKILKSLIEPLQSIKEIKVYGANDFFIKKNITLNKQLSRIQIFLNILSSTPRVIIEFLLISIILVVIFYGIFSDNLNQENLSISGVFCIAALRMMPSMSKILNATNLIKINLPALNVILKEINDKKINKLVSKDFLNFKEEILIDNIFFEYKSTNKNLFLQFSAKIKKGKITGILGDSGVGKSTLVNIINGLIKPEKGRILVDKVDINVNNNIYKWQKNISYVPQKIFLMDESVMNNIVFNTGEKQIDQELLIKCAKIADIYEYIESLPEKFDTIIGELGSKISGGQIQRLGIARALYKKRELLILDEATNSLDPTSEIKILNNIKNYQEKLTVILISHNKNALSICDEIIDLGNK